MSKAVKAIVVAELKDRYGQLESACVVDVAGMSVGEQQQLRQQLREKSGRLEVVKNSLAKRALQECALTPLAEVLEGPCALVTTSESIIDVAKVLVEFTKEFDQLTLKQAIIEGDSAVLTVEDISKMKSWAEVLGELAMLVGSPGRSLAGCIGSPQSKVAGCLKTIVDRAA